MANNKRFKVVLLGEGRVGKTSILLRYIKGEYNDRQESTLQASYLDKRLSVDNHNVQLSLWDTAGQERFHALGPIYYRDADGALLVYDITDEQSFKKVKTWVKELKRIVGENIALCIAGNKVDLQRNRKVDEEEAKKYAISVGAAHFNTSAKLNKGLEDVFVDLTQRMIELKRKNKKGNSGNSSLLAADDEFENSGGSTKSAKSSASTPGKNKSAPTNLRSRGGGRGQTIQIVDDESRTSNSSFRLTSRTGENGINRDEDQPKTKSNCC